MRLTGHDEKRNDPALESLFEDIPQEENIFNVQIIDWHGKTRIYVFKFHMENSLGLCNLQIDDGLKFVDGESARKG